MPVLLHDQGVGAAIRARVAVATTLSRLSRKGVITRVAQGRYEIPGGSRSRADPRTRAEMIAREVATQNGARIVATGAYAAYILGLVPHAPARISFRTSGRLQNFRIGKYLVEYRHSTPSMMVTAGRTSGVVIEALKFIGRRGATPALLLGLRARLDKKVHVQLKRDARHAPGWIADLMRLIACNSST